MKEHTLNLTNNNDFSNLTASEALSSLVSNEVNWVRPESASKQLELLYDKDHQILKIVHHHFSILIENFTRATYLPRQFFVPFQLAIAFLTTKKYYISVVSKYGTFKPTISNENGNQNICIAYEEAPIKQVTFSNLNNFTITVNNEEDDTTTIIYPVSKEELYAIKTNFSFLFPWKEVVNSTHGRILIPARKLAGKFFLDGRIFAELSRSISPLLLYSYELNSNEVDKSWTIHLMNLDPVTQMIIKVLIGLNKEDRMKICQSIINNEDALEWKLPAVEQWIINYLISVHPNQYLVCDSNEESQEYIKLTLEKNKTIIYPSKITYWNYKGGFSDLNFWVLQILQKQHAKKFLNDKLIGDELNSLNALLACCQYFPQENELIKEIFAGYTAWPIEKFLDEDNKLLNILVIDDCINHCGYFDPFLNAIVIVRYHLKTLPDAFFTCYQILKTSAYSAYTGAWITAMGEYIKKLKSPEVNKENANESLISKKHLS